MFQEDVFQKLERSWINMKRFVKDFISRGLIAAGFGPLILVIIYYGFQLTENVTSRPMTEVNINILSTLFMAFVAGGIGAVFKVEKIQKYYGNKDTITKAIYGISFDVEEGEFIGIMGASGSGKTTLLNCISTIDTVSSGHIYLEEQDITEIKEQDISKFISHS